MTTPKALSQEAVKIRDELTKNMHENFGKKSHVEIFNAGYFQAKKESEGLVSVLKELNQPNNRPFLTPRMGYEIEQALKKYEVGSD